MRSGWAVRQQGLLPGRAGQPHGRGGHGGVDSGRVEEEAREEAIDHEAHESHQAARVGKTAV